MQLEINSEKSTSKLTDCKLDYEDGNIPLECIDWDLLSDKGSVGIYLMMTIDLS